MAERLTVEQVEARKSTARMIYEDQSRDETERGDALMDMSLCDLALSAKGMEGWIPVGERLPELGNYLLFADGRYSTGSYRGDGRWVSHGMDYTPSHWMPLPAAPKE